jgi:cell division protein ZapC
MLTPSERWNWNYCKQRDRLLLDINEQLQFCSELSAKHLTEKPSAKALSVTEAAAFWHVWESLEQLPIAEAELLEFSLHAIAAGYAQHTGHKSWYFAEQPPCRIYKYQLVQLCGLYAAIPAVVLELDGDSAICLLLSAGFSLSGKTLNRCSLFRVLCNRLGPVSTLHNLAQSA